MSIWLSSRLYSVLAVTCSKEVPCAPFKCEEIETQVSKAHSK